MWPGILEIASPAVMGVLNVTPDSFSDGGRYQSPDAALKQALQMAANGAAIIDVGGESTRPGAEPVDEQQELDRVIPVIEAIRAASDVAISIDTSKPGVMRAAVAAGAAMLNDVRALQEAGALAAAVQLQRPTCLMHMQGEPQTMQDRPSYDDVVAEVTAFLAERVAQCEQAGLARELLVIDPGFGFGKTPAQNIELLANLGHFRSLRCPILIGVSRKSTLGEITGREVEQRLAAGIAAAVAAVMQGAAIVRTHDVAETVDALKVAQSLIEANKI